jgi:N-acetylmuramoyl-L-alanine amidase
MKRLILLGLLAALPVATFVLAQSPTQAVVRTPTGDKPAAFVVQGGQTFVAAADVIAALGGTLAPDNNGFTVTYNGVTAAFGPDSRFGVVRDDLIEMPAAPIAVEGKPFVPWQFFSGFLAKAANLDVAWDPAARVLAVRPHQQAAVSVQPSLIDVQGISKLVLTVSGAVEYSLVKEPGLYTLRFRTPIRAPFAEQTFDDPHVAKLTFTGNELRMQLTAPEVIGDDYRLDSPFRIVIDFRKGAGPAPGTPGQTPGLRPLYQPLGIRTIVIDPGHGGKEVGALGPNGLMEKDATLTLSRKLQNALSSRLGARVILTREDDSIVSLDQRTAIANQYQADLFLSVHLNAAVVKGAKGSETYFLSLEASDELAKKAAERENAVAPAAVAQTGASADLKLILWDLAQQDYVHESSRFAATIQEELNAATGVQNRGVKQAPFKVLVGATMPAALVEVGFITNAEEEAKLQSEQFQALIIDALVRAVQRYKTEYETRVGIIKPPPPVAAPAPAAAAPVTRTGT